MTVGGKPAKEHTLNVNDTVGLDQYTIEFLELPEPLPMDEATRFVNINEMVEATVIVAHPMNEPMNDTFVDPTSATSSAAGSNGPAAPQDTKIKDLWSNTPPKQVDPLRAPLSQAPPQQAPTQHTPPQHTVSVPGIPQTPPQRRNSAEPEDSTAIIRKLQVPGGPPGGNPYATLQPSMPARGNTSSGLEAIDTLNEGTKTATGLHEPDSKSKKYTLIGATAVVAFLAFVFMKHGSSDLNSKDPFPEGQTASTDTDTNAIGGDSSQVPSESPAQPGDPVMKPMNVGDSGTAPGPAPASLGSASNPSIPAPSAQSQGHDSASSANASAAASVPVPTAVVPSPNEMGGAKTPIESPFDDTSGFDLMAVDAFFDAIDSGNEAKIKSLIEKRVVDVNLSRRKGYAALHVAAARGDLSVVKLLLKFKADPNVVDPAGATPLMWSVFRRHKQVAEFLATKTNLRLERQGGETAYSMAKRLELKGYLKFLDPEPRKVARSGSSKRTPTSLPKKKKK